MIINNKLLLLKENVPFFTLLGLICIVGFFEPKFFSYKTLFVIIADTTTLFLMAAGATFVILMGGIDLSVQSVASLTSVIVAVMIPEYGYYAILIALITSSLIGFTSGISHHFLKIPSFISTLAISGVVASAAFWFSDEKQIYISLENKERFLNWASGELFGVQKEIVIGVVALGILLVIQNLTVFGRIVKGIGSAEKVIISSGISVHKFKIIAFTLSGFMAGLSGIIFATRMSSGSPTLANEFLLPSIAAIIVGGTALTGGYGSVWRTFLGALIISVVRIGMTFMGVSIFAQQIFYGLILVLAVAITIDRTKVSIVK